MKQTDFGQKYNGIDLVKFLCAIMVMMIHIPPFGRNEEYALLDYYIRNCAARIAVPFFFIASGFFLYKKTAYEEFEFSYSGKFLLKILRLYGLWTIIYLPFCVKIILLNENGIMYGLLEYLRDILFVGSYNHLWYMNATIVGILIVSLLLLKKLNVKTIFLVSLMFYLIGLLDQSWYGIIQSINICKPFEIVLKIVETIFLTTRNGLFEGFIFICIGMMFAMLKIEIDIKKAIVGFAISYVMLFCELTFVTKYQLIKQYDMYFFLVPTAIFMFSIAKSMRLQNNKGYILLRQLSTLIFFVHIWIGVIVSNISMIMFNINVEETYLKFVITFAGSIWISLIIIKISNYKYVNFQKRVQLNKSWVSDRSQKP